MQIEVRGFREDDSQAVHGVLRTVWPDDSDRAYFARGLGGDATVLVGLLGGSLVGVGHLFGNEAHPDRDYLGVHVHPDAQGSGVGRELFAALEPHFRAGRAVQTATDERRARVAGFLAHRGFRELMRTFLPSLEVRRVVRSVLAEHAAEAARLGYEIVPWADAPQLSRERLARLHRRVYADQHTWNPTLPMTDAQAVEAFMGDDAIPEAVFVALRDGQPVGVSSLRGEGDEREIAWCGVLPEHWAHERTLVLALTHAEIGYALGCGVSTLVGEFDSLIPSAMMVLEALPFSSAPAWVTYLRPPGAA